MAVGCWIGNVRRVQLFGHRVAPSPRLLWGPRLCFSADHFIIEPFGKLEFAYGFRGRAVGFLIANASAYGLDQFRRAGGYRSEERCGSELGDPHSVRLYYNTGPAAVTSGDTPNFQIAFEAGAEFRRLVVPLCPPHAAGVQESDGTPGHDFGTVSETGSAGCSSFKAPDSGVNMARVYGSFMRLTVRTRSTGVDSQGADGGTTFHDSAEYVFPARGRKARRSTS